MKIFFYLYLIFSFKSAFAQTIDCSKWSIKTVETLVFNDLYGKEIEKVEEAVSYCNIKLSSHNRDGDSFVSLAQRMSNHSYREYFCKNKLDPFLCNISYVHNFRHDLEEASKEGNIKKIEELLKKGAHPDGILHDKEVEYQKNLGKTPLFLAIEQGHLEIAKLLISYGARVEIGYRKQGWLGQVGLIRPLDYALRFEKNDFVKMLVKRGASILKKSTFDDSKYPLALAYNENIDVFFFMIENCFDDVDEVEDHLSRFLFYQTNKNEKWFNVVKKLINVNRFDPKFSYNGDNLLTYAIRDDAPIPTIQKLIEIGADINYHSDRINSHYGSPLKVAIDYGRTDIINLLLSYNPNLNVVIKGRYANINLLMHALFRRSNNSLELANLFFNQGVSPDFNNPLGKYFVRYAKNVGPFEIDHFYRNLDRFLDFYMLVSDVQDLYTGRYPLIYRLVWYGNDSSLYYALRLLELGNNQYLESVGNSHAVGDTYGFAYQLINSVGRVGANNEYRSRIIQLLASKSPEVFDYRQGELGIFYGFPKFENNNNLDHYLVLKEIYNTGKLDLNKPVYLLRSKNLARLQNLLYFMPYEIINLD